MWFTLLFLLLGQQLGHGTSCPSSCQCNHEGAVQCIGSITDVPSPMPINTYLLELVRTQITVLGEKSLQQLPLVLRLGFSHSPLNTIHPAAFNLVPQLLSLKLSANKLSYLPLQVFDKLANLEQLFLNNNQLELIQPGLFDALLRLTLLDLSMNRITHLDRDIFRNLASLRFLNLGKNSLSKLPGTIFSSLTSLQYLILYFNQLETLQEGTFDNLTNLLELELFNNKIEYIPPRLFWSLSNLQSLTLSSNELQRIPDESFYYMPKITKLTLYKNPLTFLPDQLVGHMPRLKQFYLYATELKTVPENLFANMTGLEILSLNINWKLEHLPKNVFCCLPNLYRLNLHANNLTSLHPEIFSGLTNLTTLFLHFNKLHSLPSNIFYNLPKLANVSLDNNQLTTFPGNVLSIVPSLKQVTLQNNPWHCTCDILDLAEWMSERQSIISDYKHVVCQTPSHLLNHTLGSLTSEFLRCGITSVEGHSIPTELDRNTMAGSVDEYIISDSTTVGNTITTAATVPSEQTSTLPFIFSYFPTTRNTSKTRETASPVTLLISPSSIPTLQHTTVGSISTEGNTYGLSPVFYEVVLLEAEDSIVHNNRYNGWVYLWTLPPSGPYSTFLMTFHVILVATAVVLLVANAFALYRLNQAVDNLVMLATSDKVRIASGKKQRYSHEV